LPDRLCFHCKQPAGPGHDCWTTTERALTKDLSEDLQDAWERLRETAAEFGDQRIYASHHSIMFARTVCYFFVRPKKKYLKVCIFLNRALKAPQVRKVYESSTTKRANMLRIVHRDEVEAPITSWLLEAYDLSETLRTARAAKRGRRKRTGARKSTKTVAVNRARVRAKRRTGKKARDR
jgi:hypothetical protein